MFRDGQIVCNSCQKVVFGTMWTRTARGKKAQKKLLHFCSQECNVKAWKGMIRTPEQEAEYQDILEKTGINPATL